MLSPCRRRPIILAVLSLALLAADTVPAKKPSAGEIAQWIRQLGDNSFSVRENASKNLWGAGETAEGMLEEALKSEDAEVVRRAHNVLDKFKWGIYPETPADVVALIHTYQSTEGNIRAETLQKLLQAGPAGLHAVLKIARAETDPNQRKALGDLVAAKLPQAFPHALETNDFERFDALVELGHAGEVIGNNHYAAYWLLRGKLDERIAHFRALLVKKPSEKWYAETLVYLYRAKGDLTEARLAAEKAERADLVEGVLFEQADWKALAARSDLAMAKDDSEKLSFRAAFARLAGQPKDFETALKDLKEKFENIPKSELSYAGFPIAKAFLLNDRQAEGLALLTKIPGRDTMRFEILCTQLKFREAMALADQPRLANAMEPRILDVLKARTLYALGESDKAKARFHRMGEQIKDGVESSWAVNLLQTEYRLGLTEEAFEHCARLLSVSAKGDNEKKSDLSGRYLQEVFPEQQKVAVVWWSLLRQQFKDESAAMVLKRLRNLIEGKVPAQDVQAWIKMAERRLSLEEAEGGGPQGDRRFLHSEGGRQRPALAEVALKAGLDELTHSLLEKADTADSLTRLGDLLADKKHWTKAAERYRQAWRKDLTASNASALTTPSDPLPLFLAGDSLVKAGHDKEGKQLMERSHWVLLGDARGRFSFLRVLTERGYGDAARRETELLLRVSELNSYYSGAALRLRALAAARRKDYLAAADGHEQSMLRALQSTIHFVQSAGYVNVPSQVHQLRASALLDAGRFAEAQKQIELALAETPGNVEVAIALVPALERTGHKKETAALFDRCYTAYEKVCREYPRCASAHNSAAWMSVCCRRNLDLALEHARQAVELAPATAGYLDTLAEVHFQRGEKDQAIALQKRVVELDPKKKYFRRQLRRLEAGDPSAERPLEEDQ